MTDDSPRAAGVQAAAGPAGGRRPIRIANFSGALGDYADAFANAVRGEAVDVLIGDYLAEMTMARIAGSFAARRDQAGAGLSEYFVPTFLKQLVPELETIAERRLKIVVNAGAFNPAGLAIAIRTEIASRGLTLSVAHVEGDDLLPHVRQLAGEGELANLDSGVAAGALAEQFVAANAYLGCWGIAEALGRGVDIVICGRVTDASLVMGPAAWWHGWANDNWDALAGALAAGHIIECGPQAVGGNFSGFAELGEVMRLGFPIAEIDADGSSIITKRAEEGGAVTVDTVTAQLIYEIQGPHYLNPDVTLHLDTLRLSQQGPDRVLVSKAKGSPPSPTTKVGCFWLNGWSMTLFGYATGRDADGKIDWLARQLESVATGLALDDYRYEPLGRPAPNPKSQAEATVAIRIAAAAQSRGELVKLINGYSSFGLGGIPGYHGDVGGAPAPRVEYWPGLVRQCLLRHRIVLEDGEIVDIAMPDFAPETLRNMPTDLGETIGEGIPVALGGLVHARTGDKGANASLGLWGRFDEAWDWLAHHLSAAELGALLGLSSDVVVKRYPLPNIRAVLFILEGYFGTSGSGNIGLDQVGKALGEYALACHVSVPARLADKAAAA